MGTELLATGGILAAFFAGMRIALGFAWVVVVVGETVGVSVLQGWASPEVMEEVERQRARKEH